MTEFVVVIPKKDCDKSSKISWKYILIVDVTFEWHEHKIKSRCVQLKSHRNNNKSKNSSSSSLYRRFERINLNIFFFILVWVTPMSMWTFFVSCNGGLKRERATRDVHQWCAAMKTGFLWCTFLFSQESDLTVDRRKLRLSILNLVLSHNESQKIPLQKQTTKTEKIERFHIIGLLVVSTFSEKSQKHKCMYKNVLCSTRHSSLLLCSCVYAYAVILLTDFSIY